MKLSTLKRRAEFLRIRGGRRWSGPAFLIEGKPREEASGCPDGPRFGFTVTRKLGGAVVRNRIRRRLKAALHSSAEAAAPHYDYVIVARARAADAPFDELKADMARALARIGSGKGSSGQTTRK